MEKGDIYGIIGMVLGVQAAIDIVLYFVYGMFPLFQSMWGLFMIIFYAMIYGGGIVGLVLSIVGISMNGSKFGIVGLVSAVGGISIFTLIVLGVL